MNEIVNKMEMIFRNIKGRKTRLSSMKKQINHVRGTLYHCHLLGLISFTVAF